MVSTDTDAGTPPPPIFAPEEPLESLWVRAYQGEVQGEVLFSRIADRLPDPEHAAKMRVLAEVERRTKEAVAPALERAGLPTTPDPEMVRLAHAIADTPESGMWQVVLGEFETITAQFLRLYRRIGELCPAERDTVDVLLAHEEALRDFARAELDGRPEHSLDPVNALAHMR